MQNNLAICIDRPAHRPNYQAGQTMNKWRWRLICALLIFIASWTIVRSSLIVAVYYYDNELQKLDKPQTVDKELVERVKKHYNLP